MEESGSISLVDNTTPSQQPSSGDLESLQRTSTVARQNSRSSRLNRVSVSGQLAKRKYAKWQPDRLGVASDTETSPSRESSRARGSISAGSSGAPPTRQPSQHDSGLGLRESDTLDFAPTRTQSRTNATTHSSATNAINQHSPDKNKKPISFSRFTIPNKSEINHFCLFFLLSVNNANAFSYTAKMTRA